MFLNTLSFVRTYIASPTNHYPAERSSWINKQPMTFGQGRGYLGCSPPCWCVWALKSYQCRPSRHTGIWRTHMVTHIRRGCPKPRHEVNMAFVVKILSSLALMAKNLARHPCFLHIKSNGGCLCPGIMVNLLPTQLLHGVHCLPTLSLSHRSLYHRSLPTLDFLLSQINI